MNKIKILLHKLFSDDAIAAAAICEQMEDIRYCTEHKMNHMNGGKEKDKWLLADKKAEHHIKADNQKTFTHQNVERFKKEVNDILKNKPKIKLYDGLTENEHYAVRYFYYKGTY